MFMKNSWIFYGSWFLEFLPASGVAQFYRTCRGSNLFPKSKVTNLKILGFFPEWYLQGSKSGKDFWADLAKFTKVPLAIQFSHGRTSFDILLLPLSPPPFKNVMKIFMKVLPLIYSSRDANCFLYLPLTRFDHHLTGKVP